MGTVALALAVALGLGTGEAQTSPVCHNNPGTGERIECKEPADSTADIDINLQSGVNIETSAEGADGILGEHRGAGDIRINVRGVPDAATITTSGHSADGIYGNSWGKGSVDITVRDVEINTTATEEDRFDGARGVAGQISTSNALAPYEGLYHVNINVTGSRITTMGERPRDLRPSPGDSKRSSQHGQPRDYRNQYGRHDNGPLCLRPLCEEC